MLRQLYVISRQGASVDLHDSAIYAQVRETAPKAGTSAIQDINPEYLMHHSRAPLDQTSDLGQKFGGKGRF
jgi:hypothetical protein